MTFTPDLNIQTVAEAYAQDACDFLRQHFNITLDWSDASIRQIEIVMAVFHREAAGANPPAEQVMGFAKMFGSYIGEVYRRNHGASWGIIESGPDRFPGMKANSTGGLFWPWGRAQSRLIGGAENNVWDYYSALVAGVK